jgi:leucyl aminopeptidase (aminopeptidase T)
MTKLEKAAQTVINKCLDVKRDEAVLIIADEPFIDIASLIFNAANKRTKHVHLLRLTSQLIRQGIMSDPVATLMTKMDAIVMMTSASMSHTEARRQASRQGARIVSMPGITNETFMRLAETDYEKVSRLSQKLRDVLTIAKEAKVTAPNGTHLVVPISRREGHADTGILLKPGTFSNLPAGEASIAPDDGATEGELIVDSGMGVMREDHDPLVITIKKGRATRINGGLVAERLRRRLAPFGPSSRKVAEFGIGTNKSARLCGYALEDEKVLGTVHIALGNDVSFGGANQVPIHVDAVVYKASLVIDGRKILDDGRLALE